MNTYRKTYSRRCSISFAAALAAALLAAPLFTLARAPFAAAQNAGAAETALTPAQFVSRVLTSSTDAKLVDLQAQVAYQTRELTRVKLSVPTLNLKLYPFGYDSRRTDTFISQYAFNPTQGGNPVVFSGLRQFGIDRTYYNFGAGLELKTLTPLGGYLGFNVDYFFLVNKDSEDYRQRIKFDFVFTQPLFVNNIIADLRPFSNEFKILNDRYTLSLVERRERRNALIKGGYEQAFALLTLQRQVALLEKTVAMLETDVRAVEIRRAAGQISASDADAVKVLLNERAQQLRDAKSAYNDLRRLSERMAAVTQDSLIITETTGIGGVEEDIKAALASDDITKNSDVRKKSLEYEIASKGIYAKEIQSRPTISFNLSVQPRYPEERENSGDFITSFTDFTKTGSTVDFLFTTEFSIPLLTAFERRHRRLLDVLSTEANRLLYEKALEDAQRRMRRMRDTYEDALANLRESDLEIRVQRVLLAQKKAQVSGGSAARQDFLRQELQLMQAENKRWDILKTMLLMQLDILNEKGMALDEVLRGAS